MVERSLITNFHQDKRVYYIDVLTTPRDDFSINTPIMFGLWNTPD